MAKGRCVYGGGFLQQMERGNSKREQGGPGTSYLIEITGQKGRVDYL